MDEVPRMSREKYVETMPAVFEETMRKVADAINDAPAGRVIAASEENVRDLLEEFRQKAYEMGLQMRVDAAEAAFSPSEKIANVDGAPWIRNQIRGQSLPGPSNFN